MNCAILELTALPTEFQCARDEQFSLRACPQTPAPANAIALSPNFNSRTYRYFCVCIVTVILRNAWNVLIVASVTLGAFEFAVRDGNREIHDTAKGIALSWIFNSRTN